MPDIIRVLLVIFNEKDHLLFNRALRGTKKKIDFHYVVDATAAEIALKRGSFDCILMDNKLPDCSAEEFIGKLHVQIPVIVLTDPGDEESGKEALRYGAQDYLVKGEITGSLVVRSIRYAIERQRMSIALQELSLLDELSGLYNEQGFMLFANQHLKLINRNKQKMCLFFICLDNFQYVNDTFGRHVGNGALLEVAGIVQDIFRSSDLLSRIGRDEFVALAMDVDSKSRDKIIDRLEAKIRDRNEVAADEYELSVCLGTAVYDPTNQCSIEEMLELAQKKMSKKRKVKSKI
jgi:diguanylate cyclase (GGDEF)-like protein